MKLSIVLSLLLFSLVAKGAIFPTQSFDGFEVVWLDKPSYLYHIHHGWYSPTLYVFGEDTLRLVTTYPEFTVDIDPNITWNFPFTSIRTFYNGTDLWALGTALPYAWNNPKYPEPTFTEGYTLPIGVIGQPYRGPINNFTNNNIQYHVQGIFGATPYNVWVNATDVSNIVSYYVGWYESHGRNDSYNFNFSLAVLRTHTNLEHPTFNWLFEFFPEWDVAPLRFQNGEGEHVYTTYGGHYKPHIHYYNVTNQLIVIEPHFQYAYVVTLPGNVWGGDKTPLTPGVQTGNIFQVNSSIVSSWFDPIHATLYIGYAAEGWGNGSIIAYGFPNFNVKASNTFWGTLSNPRALVLDEFSKTPALFVGFNGGEHILKLDPNTLAIIGNQRAPDYLHALEAGTVGGPNGEHIYFITNDQHAKVLRIKQEDFCTELCPIFGYCSNGKCVCNPNTHMAKNGKSCEWNTKDKKDEQAATALGVMFALTFVVAAVGWLLYYRTRRGSYTQV